MTNPGAILITGAGRGIGAALARAYARPGISLFLGDLVPDGLSLVGDLCTEAGARVYTRVIDVRARAGMEQWISDSDDHRELDLVIANAGISHGNMKKEETDEQFHEVFDVNVHGVLNTILPALSLMRSRRRGQVALMSSLAGLRGMPHSPSYCASKAAVRTLGQGLSARVKEDGIVVSVIIPAFVKTPMTDSNLYGMPWRLDSDQAADIIKRNLSKGKAEFIFPKPYTFIGWLMHAVPGPVVEKFVRFADSIGSRGWRR